MRRKWFMWDLGVTFASLLLLSIFSLIGCGEGGGRPSQGGIPTGSVTGRLVKGGGKSRVVAAVAIMGVKTVQPQVQFDGDRFRVDNVPAGEQVIQVYEQGSLSGAMFVVQVLPGKVTDVGDVEAEPLGRLSGFVYEVDEEGNKGKPIPGAEVIARAIGSSDDEMGEISRGIFGVARTDEDGSYELLLPPGSYVVKASARGYQVATDIVDIKGLVTTALDFGLLRLPPEGIGRVYGKVAAELNGEVVPVAGAVVILAPKGAPRPPQPNMFSSVKVSELVAAHPNALSKGKDKEQVVIPPAFGRLYFAFTDADGNYEINDVKPGEYKAVAFKEGYGSDEKDVQVKPNEGVRVDFMLKAGLGIVQGRVSDAETKEPIEGATIIATHFGDPWWLWNKWSELRDQPGILVSPRHGKRGVIPMPSLKPIRPPKKLPPIRPPMRAGTTTDKDGFYKLVLPKGEWFISVWKDGYMPHGAVVNVSAGQMVEQNFELRKFEIITLMVELDMPGQVKVGEPVTMKLIVRNEGDEPITLRFNTGQRYDFIVRDMEGNVVWQWSRDKAFIQVIGEVTIQPNGELTFVETWTQVDNEGNKVGAGEYEVEGIVTSEEPMSAYGFLVIEGGEQVEGGGGHIGIIGLPKKVHKR